MSNLWATDAVETALGRRHRDDETAARHGGPAGNASLSAWTGLLLLVLFAAEGITVLSVGRLLTWHVLVGGLIIGPLVLKLGSTGWRMVSYYAHRAPYVRSGPPPMVFRLLGPLVVLSSVVLIGSGVVLILIGQASSHSVWFTVAGFRVDWIFVHQVSFFVWFAVMTVHVLGRTIPAAQIARGRVQHPRAVPGIAARAVALVAVIALGVGCGLFLVNDEGSWQQHYSRHDFQSHQRAGAHSAIRVLS